MSKKRIKNKVPHLLDALFQHPDTPEWLIDGVWEAFNNRTGILIFPANYWRSQSECVKATRKFHKGRKKLKEI